MASKIEIAKVHEMHLMHESFLRVYLKEYGLYPDPENFNRFIRGQPSYKRYKFLLVSLK